MSAPSRIWHRVRAGEILQEILIIDVHAHMGPWHNFYVPENPWGDGMVAVMDSCGIDVAVTAPIAGIGPDPVLGNRQAAEAADRYPDRIAAYCTVSPNCPETEMVQQMETCVLGRGFKGIKIHSEMHRYPVEGPGYRAAWAFAHEHDLPRLVHTWEASPRCGPLLLEPIGKEFPRARIIIGHSGVTPQGIREAIQAANRTPNLYLDLTKSYMHRGLLEEMTAAVGAERLLFGTDFPFLDCRPQIGYVAIARIPDENKRKIFGLNAKQLFDL